MSRSNLFLAAGAGALAALAVQGIVSEPLDAAELAAAFGVTCAIGGGSAGAAWYWFKERADVRAEARALAARADAERHRHRAERTRRARMVTAIEEYPIEPGPVDEHQEPADQLPARAAFQEYPGRAEARAAAMPAGVEPRQLTEEEVADLAARFNAAAPEPARWIDPYRTPGAVDRLPAPAAPVDEHADLYARQDTIQIPADATVADGWDDTRLDVETYLRGNTYVRMPARPATP